MKNATKIDTTELVACLKWANRFAQGMAERTGAWFSPRPEVKEWFSRCDKILAEGNRQEKVKEEFVLYETNHRPQHTTAKKWKVGGYSGIKEAMGCLADLNNPHHNQGVKCYSIIRKTTWMDPLTGKRKTCQGSVFVEYALALGDGRGTNCSSVLMLRRNEAIEKEGGR